MRGFRCVVFFCVLALEGCGYLPKYQTPYINPSPLVQGPDVGTGASGAGKSGPSLFAQGTAFSMAYAAAKKSESQENLKRFVESGMAYADLQCSYYFTRLDYTRAQRDFAQKETSLVGSLTTALLGLADAGSAVTGAAGAAFGFTSSSFDTYNSSFLASDDVGLLQQLVLSVQKNDKIEILRRIDNADQSATWPARTDTLDLAVSDLNIYLDRCTPIGIRNLLKESILSKTNVEAGKSEKGGQ